MPTASPLPYAREAGSATPKPERLSVGSPWPKEEAQICKFHLNL